MIESKPIVRRRGDTSKFRITFTSSGIPLQLSGTVVLVITEQSAPTATDTPIATLTGTLINAGANGVVEFQPTTNDADNVGAFFYEVQMTDSGGDIRTLLEGDYIMEQDRAK